MVGAGRLGERTQRVGAGVAVLHHATVLLVCRTDNGLWDVPGGAVEPGEAVEDAARRELLEETSLSVGPLKLLGVFSGPNFQHTYPDGHAVEWVTVLFAASWQGEAPKPGDDAAQVAWWPLTALPGNSAPATAHSLGSLQGNSGAAYA
ncbi:MAG: hypothetical protein JWQ08_685 [Deinococcus sp.]|nr:hypothetical protein [Deinococcus sp.]